jgi:hypothetical protein
MQSILLLVAPALFAASIYIILGRIILLVDGEKYSLIRQKRLTAIFVTGDVISFIVQCGGGGIQAAGSLSLLHLGEKVIIVGLFLQLTFFGFFVIVTSMFHYRIVKANPTCDSTETSQKTASTDFDIHVLPWKRHMAALYVTSALIMLRSVFRVVEYLQGNSGYLLRHEVFLYTFDASLMLLVMCLFHWIHPAEVTNIYQQRIESANTGHNSEMR